MPLVFMYKPVRDSQGRWIIDEVCTCGCLMTRHADSANVGPFAPGHGHCTDCQCAKFVWKEFVYADKP